MAYKATTRPTGFTNNTRVTCSGCGARNLYVNGNQAKKSGGWECPHCKKRH